MILRTDHRTPPNRLRKQHLVFSFLMLTMLLIPTACGIYSFTGAATKAKNISVSEFYNNTDLGPANLGQTFTNSLKNYFVQNSSLNLATEDGELQMEGEMTGFTLTPISPTPTNSTDPTQVQTFSATSTRLTITVKVTYTDNLDESLSFKDKTFSFYKDFTNDQNLSDIQDQLIKDIFTRIINDIFNASIANW